MAVEEVYAASPIKRRRATQDEMEERAEFLIDYAAEHGPVTVRGLYYQAEVAGVPGIDKTDSATRRCSGRCSASGAKAVWPTTTFPTQPDGCGNHDPTTASRTLSRIPPGPIAGACGRTRRPTSRSGARRMRSPGRSIR